MQRSLTRDRANNATQKALKTPDIEALDIVVQDRIETFCSHPEGEQDSEVEAHGQRRKMQFKDIGYKSAGNIKHRQVKAAPRGLETRCIFFPLMIIIQVL